MPVRENKILAIFVIITRQVTHMEEWDSSPFGELAVEVSRGRWQWLLLVEFYLEFDKSFDIWASSLYTYVKSVLPLNII